jgi:hypothetical protein
VRSFIIIQIATDASIYISGYDYDAGIQFS